MDRPKQSVLYRVLDNQGNIVRQGRCQRQRVAEQAKAGQSAVEVLEHLDDRLFRVVDDSPVRKHTDEELDRVRQAELQRQQEALRLIARRHELKHQISQDALSGLTDRQLLRILAWILATDEPESTLNEILGT